MSENKDWLETNDNAKYSQKEKIEKGKEEESQLKKESRTKENIL